MYTAIKSTNPTIAQIVTAVATRVLGLRTMFFVFIRFKVQTRPPSLDLLRNLGEAFKEDVTPWEEEEAPDDRCLSGILSRGPPFRLSTKEEDLAGGLPGGFRRWLVSCKATLARRL